MFNKKIILILTIILVSLFAVSAVSAADNATSDIVSVEETTDEVVSIEDNQTILEENDVGTFSDLATKINSGAAEISLDKDYKYNSDSDSDYKKGIEIKNAITIDGNWHRINGTGTSLMFNIAADNVILKNMNITLGGTSNSWNYDCYSDFLEASKINNVNIINCNFDGYANTVLDLHEANNSYIENCNFDKCIFYYEGGCCIDIRGGSNNKIAACDFINTSSTIIEMSGCNHKIQNCKFINSYNGDYNYIIRLDSYEFYYYEEYRSYDAYNCTIDDCIFDGTGNYGSIFVNGIDNKLNNCKFFNITGSTIEMSGENGIINKCSFIVIDDYYGDSIIMVGGDGNTINECEFVNSSIINGYAKEGNGGSIYVGSSNNKITNCVFINSTATDKGGAIYSTGDNLTIIGNTFINNNAPWGKSIFIIDGTIKDNYFDGGEEEIFAFKHVEIIKKQPALTLNDIAFNYNNAINYSISLKYNNAPLTNRKIILEIFTNDYHINHELVTNEEGIVNIFNLIKDLGVGTWNVKANYLGDANYESVSESAKITIKPVTPRVILNDIAANVDEETIINAVINRPDNVVVNNGVVKFYVEDSLIGSSYVTNNRAYVTYYPSNAGNFTLKAVFEDSENHISSNNVSNLAVRPKIEKVDLNQNISDDNNHIEFNLPPDATGIVTVTISSKIYTTTIDGNVNVDLSNLTNGNYTYTVSYSGDKKYSAFLTTRSLKINNAPATPENDSSENVTKVEPNMVVSSLSEPSADGSVSVALPSDATGTVTLTINNQNYAFGIVKGIAGLFIPNLSNGNYKYTISYSGDSKYKPVTTNGILAINNKPSQENTTQNITKIKPDMTVSSLNEPSADGTVTVKLPNDATGTITLTINNQNYAFSIVNGIGNLFVPTLSNGNYQYAISYSGDLKYKPVTTNGILAINNNKPNEENTTENITKIKPDMTVSSLNEPSADGTVTVKLPNDATGTITLTINNQNYAFGIANGIAEIFVPNLSQGDYSYSISYSGDEKYYAVAKNGTIHVNGPNISIKANDMTVNYGKGYEFIATFFKADGLALSDSYVVFNVNGEDNVVKTDSNGFAMLNIGLGNGTYNIISKNLVTGDAMNNVLTVVGQPAPIIATTISAPAVTTVYNGGDNVVITLKDINGRPIAGASVSVDMNGLKSLPTDSNGQIKLSTNDLAPKKYSATIVFEGNNKYAKSTATAAVTVNKATPKLTASAKTFKISDKTKKYTVTLKTNQNKVMKSTKVSIKIGKTTFSATTNSKGVATFKLNKLTKKGKYTAAVTYSGNAYYTKLTKNVKITVK